jgi:hypothetical protein
MIKKYQKKVSLLQKWQNDRIKNIVSVFYGIQCSLNNLELNVNIMTIMAYDRETSLGSHTPLLEASHLATHPF